MVTLLRKVAISKIKSHLYVFNTVILSKTIKVSRISGVQWKLLMLIVLCTFQKFVRGLRWWWTWWARHQRQWGRAQRAVPSNRASTPSRESRSAAPSRSCPLRWRNHSSVCPRTLAHLPPGVVHALPLGLKQQEIIGELQSRYRNAWIHQEVWMWENEKVDMI